MIYSIKNGKTYYEITFTYHVLFSGAAVHFEVFHNERRIGSQMLSVNFAVPATEAAANARAN